MTVKSIEEQINTIREATQKAAASPEAALEFLRRAGIVEATNAGFAVKHDAGRQSRAGTNSGIFTKTK